MATQISLQGHKSILLASALLQHYSLNRYGQTRDEKRPPPLQTNFTEVYERVKICQQPN
jgi:hypothetical protein